MLSRLVLETVSVELLLMSFPGQPASLLKPCWVTALRFGDSQHALSGEDHLCRCLHMSFCPLTNSNSDPKVRHLWERSCGKRFRECSIIPGLHKQSFKKRQRVHHLVGWLKSCRCTSPIKRKSQSLHGGARGGSRGCSFYEITAAMLYKSYSVQIF